MQLKSGWNKLLKQQDKLTRPARGLKPKPMTTYSNTNDFIIDEVEEDENNYPNEDLDKDN